MAQERRMTRSRSATKPKAASQSAKNGTELAISGPITRRSSAPVPKQKTLRSFFSSMEVQPGRNEVPPPMEELAEPALELPEAEASTSSMPIALVNTHGQSMPVASPFNALSMDILESQKAGPEVHVLVPGSDPLQPTASTSGTMGVIHEDIPQIQVDSSPLLRVNPQQTAMPATAMPVEPSESDGMAHESIRSPQPDLTQLLSVIPTAIKPDNKLYSMFEKRAPKPPPQLTGEGNYGTPITIPSSPTSMPISLHSSSPSSPPPTDVSSPTQDPVDVDGREPEVLRIWGSQQAPIEVADLPSSEPTKPIYIVDLDDDRLRPRGSQQAPIEVVDIPSSPVAPKVTKPIHPFFAPTARAQGARVEVTQTTIMAPQATKQLHPFFAPNSKPQSQFPQSFVADPKGKLMNKLAVELEAALPSRETQHVCDSDFDFTPSSPVLGKRKRPQAATIWTGTAVPSLNFLTTNNNTDYLNYGYEIAPQVIETCSSFDEEDADSHLESIPANVLAHPAIKRFDDLGYISPLQSCETWAEKWKPRSAEEVLGNESHAQYLKAWLRKLEIQLHASASTSTPSTSQTKDNLKRRKRQTVIRDVDQGRRGKRRKQDDWEQDSLGDWLTDDSDDGYDGYADSQIGDDDDDFSQPTVLSSPQERRRRAESLVPNAELDTASHHFSRLTNTILLSGPSGCGKTSSVFACCQQLGWKVFEVSPGVGKRTGANVAALVGEVAKNHTITKIGTGGNNVFSSPKAKSGCKGAGVARPPSGAEESLTDGEEGGVAQSIILFEEVDILFNEDVNFWPAVVKLIRTSHRPIVLTCNDPTLVPLETIPIQAHLEFEPCTSPLARHYLKCLALAEGHLVGDRDLQHIYRPNTSHHTRADYPDVPSHPVPSQRSPYADLRRAINQLQLWCTGRKSLADFRKRQGEVSASWRDSATIGDWTESMEFGFKNDVERLDHLVEVHNLHHLTRFTDNVSVVDGGMRPEKSSSIEAQSHSDPYFSEADSELGYGISLQDIYSPYPIIPLFSKEDEMSRAALLLSRRLFERLGVGPELRRGGKIDSRLNFKSMYEDAGLFLDRQEYQRDLLVVWRNVLSISGPLLPRHAIFLDYQPQIRHVEQLFNNSRAGIGRTVHARPRECR